MAVAINQSTLAWVGPSQEQDIIAEFLSFLARRAVVDADVFAKIDSDAHAMDLLKDIGSRAGLTDENIQDASLMQFFPTEKARARVQAYSELVSSKRGMVSGGLAVDPGHNPHKHLRASPWMPTITRSTRPLWLGKDNSWRFYTAREIVFLKGGHPSRPSRMRRTRRPSTCTSSITSSPYRLRSSAMP